MVRRPWLLAALLPGLAAAVDIRNCSRLPGADRYAFEAHGAQLRWQHDATLCLDAAGGADATAVALRPCAGATGWSRNATAGGFMLSPAGDATRCLRAQPQFGAPLLLPCFADVWNAKLHTELSHPHGRLGASANPCCDKQPCGSAVCSAAICAACPPSLGHCPQLSGTVWRLDAAGRLVAQMSNPFQVVNTTHPVCSHFEGCLGEMAPLEVANGVQPLAWSPIPLSTPLRPTSGGWMHKQLRAQRAGFGGHEYPMAYGGTPASVYRDKWLGGDFASGMGNMLAEGYPYWLNGWVPLVALLNDTEYITALHAQVQLIVSNATGQAGWLGPGYERSTQVPRGAEDFWLQYRMLGALTQWAELEPASAASQATIEAMLQFAQSLTTLLDEHPIVVGDWSHSRMNEVLAPLLWLVDHAPSGSDLKPVFSLLSKYQAQGFDWASWILSPGFPPAAGALCAGIHYERLPVHGVDIGTGLMQEGHLFRMDGDATHLRTGKAQLETLMAHHGQANGVFGANECLGGRDPSIGTETCVVVEQMESMAQMFQASGDLSYMDSLEEIAFNALPAPFFNGTMGAMKYFQETDHYDADRYSQVYECCLTNHNMGWPKYAQRAAMTQAATEEGDTLAVLLFHGFAAHSIPLPSGSTADLSVTTEYPFEEEIEIRVDTAAGLTLALRIPQWCKSPTVTLPNATIAPAIPGTLFKARLGPGASTIKLSLPMDVWLENRTLGRVAVHRGPLLYSHNVEWQGAHPTGPHTRPGGQCAPGGLFPRPRNETFLCDISLTPRTPVSPQQLGPIGSKFTARRRKNLGETRYDQGVFSSMLVPVELEVVPDAGGEPFTLIPYGATDLRITELFPAAALPPLPPPLQYPLASLAVAGSGQLPFLPTAFNGTWPQGKMDGPALTDNSGKDKGFITLRSGQPHAASTVQVFPRIRATSAHPLRSVSVAVRYVTGYVGSDGADLAIFASVVGKEPSQANLLNLSNLTQHSFDACHQQRCYSPALTGTATFETPVVGDVQLELRFVNRERNLQLLLPFTFDLTWEEGARNL